MLIYGIALVCCSLVNGMDSYKNSCVLSLARSFSDKHIASPESKNASPLRRSNGSNPIAIDFSYLFDAVRKNDHQTIKNTKASVLRSVYDQEGNNLLQIALSQTKHKPNLYMVELLTPLTNFLHKNEANRTVFDCMDIDSSEYYECAAYIAHYLEKRVVYKNIKQLTYGEIKILSAQTSQDDLQSLKSKYVLIKRYLDKNNWAISA